MKITYNILIRHYYWLYVICQLLVDLFRGYAYSRPIHRCWTACIIMLNRRLWTNRSYSKCFKMCV